ncbi:MAG: hypothetical protein M1813_007740 [Trichoglossum hirsutum]|nr:MAG: hypothetical protein M1813_007740 [Trichoglossum hirsutum]
MTDFVGGGESANWHNDSNEKSWMMYLVEKSSHIFSTIDPQLPTPGFSKTAPYVEALFQEFFAILLSLRFELFSSSTGRRLGDWHNHNV